MIQIFLRITPLDMTFKCGEEEIRRNTAGRGLEAHPRVLENKRLRTQYQFDQGAARQDQAGACLSLSDFNIPCLVAVEFRIRKRSAKGMPSNASDRLPNLSHACYIENAMMTSDSKDHVTMPLLGA